MTERWLPAVGFEGRYEVSDLGRVRSLLDNRGRPKLPLLLALQVHPKSGYVQVNFKVDGRVIRPYVARLVLEAFVGPCPEGQEACHGDGVRGNNVLANLRWDTHIANIADKKAHGTISHGERNGQSKLTQAQVDQIRVRCAGGEKHWKLAREFGVSDALISLIKSGQRWAEVV
jgi:hypothetical protein